MSATRKTQIPPELRAAHRAIGRIAARIEPRCKGVAIYLAIGNGNGHLGHFAAWNRTITIAPKTLRNYSPAQHVDLLLHEWAHVVAWRRGHGRPWHGEQFKSAHAELFYEFTGAYMILNRARYVAFNPTDLANLAVALARAAGKKRP